MKKQKKKAKYKKIPGRSFWSKRNIVIFIISTFLVFIIYFLFLRDPDGSHFKKEGEVTFIDKFSRQHRKEIDVEVANNNTERMQGLMYRRHMDEDNGMLFIFEHPDMQSFWMKNTILPLDIMFIDSTGVIDTIYRNTTPYSEKSLPSRRRVQFVVEVNGGWSDKNAVKEGDLIEFKVDRK